MLTPEQELREMEIQVRIIHALINHWLQGRTINPPQVKRPEYPTKPD